MYNEQIESLIDLAITDGTLTDKERQILYKRAEAAGIDLDEFEMVLNAKLFEKSKEQQSSTYTSSPSEKSEESSKCPNCAGTISSMSAICAYCGYEFTNIEATNSTQKLYDELIRVEEEERNRPKSSSGISSLTSFLTGSDHDPLAEQQLNARIFKRKISVVSMFPVPNTKTDILEFMSLAVSEGGKEIKGFFSTQIPEEKDYIRAWRAKAEQVVVKARFSLKDDSALIEEINLYARQLQIKD